MNRMIRLIPKKPSLSCRFFSSKSWERSARLVKDTDVTNPYLEHIRAAHDPALHIKTLEDELRGTMGKALGRQGEKILSALKGMEEQRKQWDELVDSDNVEQLTECVELHNQYRKEAIQARWELVVQRQAIGMLVNNQKFVHDAYPIGDALPLPGDEMKTEVKAGESSDKQFGDQLDWWQKVGRWR